VSRYRIDTLYGYISITDEKLAWEIYKDPTYNAIRIRKCKDIYDEGIILDGKPIIEDFTRKPWEQN